LHCIYKHNTTAYQEREASLAETEAKPLVEGVGAIPLEQTNQICAQTEKLARTLRGVSLKAIAEKAALLCRSGIADTIGVILSSIPALHDATFPGIPRLIRQEIIDKWLKVVT
jgi:hypothetical protein